MLAGSVAFLLAFNLWLATSYVAPLQDQSDLQYIVVLRPWWHLGAALAIAAVGVGVAFAVAGTRLRAAQSGLSWLLFPVCGPMLALGALATPLWRYASPWAFLFLDLYVWLILSAVLTAAAFMWRERLAQRMPRAADVLLIAVLAAVALGASPPLRFQSAVLGDEPKYLRFAENWYRGQGLNIEHFPDIPELPEGFGPDPLGNLRALGRALPVIASDAARDLTGAWTGQQPPSETRTGANWFIEGRHGGRYQVHPPGFSLLLVPGYFIDRYVSTRASLFNPQFPARLVATNLTVLLLFLFWGVALFRLLRAQTRESLVPWVIAFVVMTTLPVTAFNYQYYPEAAAGLVLTATLWYVLHSTRERAWMAFLWGGLAGFLPWLHLRFGVLTVLLALAVAITPQRARRTVVWFWFGAAVPLGLLGVYTYYLSGSVLPWALYEMVEDSPGFSLRRALDEAPWLWLDQSWGLLPHAPVYLLAVPGLLLLWRKDRRATLFLAAALVSVSLLAGAHGVTGGRTTPMRLIAAVVPLFALPLAEAAVTYRRSRLALMLFAVLAIVSIHNGVSYNRFLIKHNAALAGSTASGWKTTLMFPDLEGGSAASGRAVFWIAVTVLLAAVPLVERRARPTGVRRPPAHALAAVAALFGFAATGSAIAAATGEGVRERYLRPPGDVRYEVLHSFLERRGAAIWSPRLGTVDPLTLFPPATPSAIVLRPEAATAAVGEEVVFTAEAVAPPERLAWGMATIDYGDGTALHRAPLVGDEFVRHRYDRPGEYVVTVYFAPPRVRAGPPVQGSAIATVTAAGVDAP